MILRDFFEHDMFDIMASFHAVRFTVRNGITLLCHGNYDVVMTWMKFTGHSNYEVVSAKLDYINDTIDVRIK